MMSEFVCSVSIPHARFAALRTAFASLNPVARERNTVEFSWRSDELDITFEPSTAPAEEMDYLGSGSIFATREMATEYCERLFTSLSSAGLVASIELYEDDVLLLERRHSDFVR
jgi:hypothetical protein